jgi:acyl carrier protein
VSEIMETLRQFLRKEFPTHKAAIDSLGPDDSLLKAGILDSLSFLSLISYIEETWSVAVPPQDFVPDLFDSMARMEAYISSRRA